MEFTKLTREHGIKIAPAFPCSVEQCGLAVGEVVGHSYVKSAARMNSAVVIFLSLIDKVKLVVERGVTINDTFVAVLPLATPAQRITLANVPPFISDETILLELARYGKIVSPMRKLSSGFKSPLLKHVVSHRRQVYMITKKNEDISLSFNIKNGQFNYLIYATSVAMKCFGCGREGHQIRACPDKDNREGQGAPNRPTQEQTGDTGPVQDKGHTVAGGEDRLTQEQMGDTGPIQDKGHTVEGGEEGTVGIDEQSGVIKTTETRTDGMTSDQNGVLINETEMMIERVTSEQVEEKSVEVGVETGSDGMDMAEEENLCKIPKKRKTSTGSIGSQPKRNVTRKAKRNETGRKATEQDADSTDDPQTDSDEDRSEAKAVAQKGKTRQAYSVNKIKQFLQTTKNMKGVNVEDHFSDRAMFVDFTRPHIRQGSFTDQEVFRLKKFIQKCRQEKNSDGNETV